MTFEPTPIGDVSAREQDGNWTLVFVRDLKHPPEKVWSALTDPRQLAKWAPYTAGRDLGGLGDVVLTMIDSDTPQDIPARVTGLEPLKLLEYTWGGDVLRWELTPISAGTQLTLLHTVDDRKMVPMVAAGWHLCLDIADRVLAGEDIAPIRGDEARNFGWEELHEAYRTRLSIQD